MATKVCSTHSTSLRKNEWRLSGNASDLQDGAVGSIAAKRPIVQKQAIGWAAIAMGAFTGATARDHQLAIAEQRSGR
jgi:hypothetical protein